MVDSRMANDIEPIEVPDTPFASHAILWQTLSGRQLPTKINILYMPMHGNYLLQGIENYRQCKGSINRLVEKFSNVAIIDRMKIDATTSADKNYWDSLHFSANVAESLEQEVAK